MNLTSGTPNISSRPWSEICSWLYSDPGMVCNNTWVCPVGWQMHLLRLRHTFSIVYCLTLMNLLCVTLMIYWSTQPMWRNMQSMSEMWYTTYKMLGSVARPKRANSEFEKSWFLDSTSTQMDGAFRQTTYPPLTTGGWRYLIRLWMCSSVTETSTGDWYSHMQLWWFAYKPFIRYMAHRCGNGLGMPVSHLEST